MQLVEYEHLGATPATIGYAGAAYDRIGLGYAGTRRPDPRLAARIRRAIGKAQSVVNIGAGTGSYEPSDLDVIAVEPSREMISQRPPGPARVIQASAEALPLPDDCVDAAMTILSIHHWDDAERGVAEMSRVARSRVVVLTFQPECVQQWWLRDYAPEIGQDDGGRFLPIEDLTAWLPGSRVEVVEIPADCSDLFLGALWARPELILDHEVRASTSGFARLDDSGEKRVVASLRADLESGRWDRLYGRVRDRATLDVGVRLVVGELDSASPTASRDPASARPAD